MLVLSKFMVLKESGIKFKLQKLNNQDYFVIREITELKSHFCIVKFLHEN